MMFFAQAGPEVPWSITNKWVLGLLGFMGVVWLVFAVVIQAKKLFGRIPPITEELDHRDKSIRRQIYAVEKNLQAAHIENTRRIEALEERYDEMQRDRIRKWGELKDELGQVGAAVAFIKGKLEGEDK